MKRSGSGKILMADGGSRFLQRQKARFERRKARQQLRMGGTPIPAYGKYKGWET